MSQALVGDFELERVFIDATIVRAPARRRRPKKVDPQAFGRSRGGLSTKLHFAVDALGNPLRLMLTAGQIADIDCAQDLVANSRCGALIADKGYDANALVEAIEASAQTAIPPRSNRITPLSMEWFRNRFEAKVVIEEWRRHYNDLRPHSNLGRRTPTEFKRLCIPTTNPEAVLQE